MMNRQPVPEMKDVSKSRQDSTREEKVAAARELFKQYQEKRQATPVKPRLRPEAKQMTAQPAIPFPLNQRPSSRIGISSSNASTVNGAYFPSIFPEHARYDGRESSNESIPNMSSLNFQSASVNDNDFFQSVTEVSDSNQKLVEKSDEFLSTAAQTIAEKYVQTSGRSHYGEVPDEYHGFQVQDALKQQDGQLAEMQQTLNFEKQLRENQENELIIIRQELNNALLLKENIEKNFEDYRLQHQTLSESDDLKSQLQSQAAEIEYLKSEIENLRLSKDEIDSLRAEKEYLSQQFQISEKEFRDQIDQLQSQNSALRGFAMGESRESASFIENGVVGTQKNPKESISMATDTNYITKGSAYTFQQGGNAENDNLGAQLSALQQECYNLSSKNKETEKLLKNEQQLNKIMNEQLKTMPDFLKIYKEEMDLWKVREVERDARTEKLNNLVLIQEESLTQLRELLTENLHRNELDEENDETEIELQTYTDISAANEAIYEQKYGIQSDNPDDGAIIDATATVNPYGEQVNHYDSYGYGSFDPNHVEDLNGVDPAIAASYYGGQQYDTNASYNNFGSTISYQAEDNGHRYSPYG